jgi:hypothetical protein
MMSGVSAPVAIKVFGPDLDTLRDIGTQIQTLAKKISGFEDAKLDQQSSIPQLRIEADRDGTLTARCPAHEDGTASLSVRDKGGKVLLHCHAGCSWRAVADALQSSRVSCVPAGTCAAQEQVRARRAGRSPRRAMRVGEWLKSGGVN